MFSQGMLIQGLQGGNAMDMAVGGRMQRPRSMRACYSAVQAPPALAAQQARARRRQRRRRTCRARRCQPRPSRSCSAASWWCGRAVEQRPGGGAGAAAAGRAAASHWWRPGRPGRPWPAHKPCRPLLAAMYESKPPASGAGLLQRPGPPTPLSRPVPLQTQQSGWIAGVGIAPRGPASRGTSPARPAWRAGPQKRPPQRHTAL